MNETYIQTIRGGIQRVFHLAKDHWTQEPKRCGFNYHHELHEYIPVCKTVQADPGSPERNMGGIRLAPLREPLPDSGADGRTDAGVRKLYKVSTTLYETFKQKSQMESHHTAAKVSVDVDGFEYRAF